MFDWTPEKIRFFRDAAEHVPFHRQLAERLRPYLPTQAHVCDVGCGLGYLSLALAPFCRQVTAIDRDPAAIAALEAVLTRQNPGNLTPLCRDVLGFTPTERFDAAVFFSFGSPEEILSLAAALTDGPVLVIKRLRQQHRFRPAEEPLRRDAFSILQAALENRGVPFRAETFSLDMSQPLRSPAEAAAFFRAYGNAACASPEKVLARLEETGDPVFPYRLLVQQQVGLLVSDTRTF